VLDEKLIHILTNDLRHLQESVARLEVGVTWLTRLGIGILAAVTAVALKSG
jgi:hypothetical protein